MWWFDKTKVGRTYLSRWLIGRIRSVKGSEGIVPISGTLPEEQLSAVSALLIKTYKWILRSFLTGTILFLLLTAAYLFDFMFLTH